jgi:cytochrome c biogenesis protein CcmG/thiol:disulfide interchange protein DsbE
VIRRLFAVIAVALLAASLAACGAEPEGSAIAPQSAELERLRKADPDASRLLPGGLKRFESELAANRGTPIVVNQWASWCGPCKAEFPYFQRLAKEYAGRVAFLGVNSQDSAEEAGAFLAEYPTPFGHVQDFDTSVARSYGGGRAWPTTVYYDTEGKLAFLHQGVYRDEAGLRKDIERYALGG